MTMWVQLAAFIWYFFASLEKENYVMGNKYDTFLRAPGPHFVESCYDSNSARMVTSNIIANQKADFQPLSWKLSYQSCYHGNFLMKCGPDLHEHFLQMASESFHLQFRNKKQKCDTESLIFFSFFVCVCLKYILTLCCPIANLANQILTCRSKLLYSNN